METLSWLTQAAEACARCRATHPGRVSSTGTTVSSGTAVRIFSAKPSGVRREVVRTRSPGVWMLMDASWLSMLSSSQSKSLLGPPMRISVVSFGTEVSGLMGWRAPWVGKIFVSV